MTAASTATSDLLSGLGVAVIDIAGDVAVTNPKIMTDKGAHAGMTIGQVKALYGSAFKVVKKTNYGVTQYFGSVKVDDVMPSRGGQRAQVGHLRRDRIEVAQFKFDAGVVGDRGDMQRGV